MDTHRILAELRQVPAIADVPEDQLMWLAGKLTEVTFPAGAIISREGGPADSFHILLEGEFQLTGTITQDGRVFVSKAGDIVGKLPYSRLTHWPGNFRAMTPGR